MKYFWTKLTTIVFILVLVSACGSGGGGSASNGGGDGSNIVGGFAPTGDTIAVSIWSLSTSTTTTTYAGDQYDPIMTAQTFTTNNKTYIDMGSGYDVVTQSTKRTLDLAVGGTTVGTYTFSSPTGTTGILYSDVPKLYQGTTGAVTITSIGNVGQPVIGTFNATLGCASGCTGTIGMSGSFSVTRTQ